MSIGLFIDKKFKITYHNGTMEKAVQKAKTENLKEKNSNGKKSGLSSKEKILHCAAKEFLKKGWEKSNIRDIARKAGVTTGSVYFHFENKEALFDDLVKDTYFELLEEQKRMYKNHFAIPLADTAKRRAFRLEKRKDMLEYAYRHFDAMKLLLCAAEGTKYADLSDKMMDTLRKADAYAYDESLYMKKLPRVDLELFIIIDGGFWECLFKIIRQDVPYEQAKRYVLILDDFYEAGWRKIFYEPAESYAPQ